MIRHVAGVFLCSVLVVAPPRTRAASGPTIPDSVIRNVRTRVERGDNVSIVIGVIGPDGRRVVGYGTTMLTGGKVPDENTVFEIGSITKAMTGTLLANMVRRGEVRLDDPVGKFLPEHVRVPTRNGKSMTLVDLATHTSALPRLPSNMKRADPADPYADYTVAQMYDFLSNHTLRRDIGSKYEYSNYGFGLLGHVLARRAGLTYEKLLEERILRPLGMPDTRIKLTDDMQRRLARGHHRGKPVANWDIPTLAGAGALRSTVKDMLTFLAANLGFDKSTVFPAMKTAHEPRHRANTPRMHVGLGWHVRTGDERTVVWHNGGTGGYRTFAGFTATERLGVVVLSNSNTSVDDVGFHLLDPTIPLRPALPPDEANKN